MVDLDPMILGGYVIAIVVLLIGLVYGFYKARKG